MYLIFDCSALAGKTDYKANFTETNAWPRLIHISWILLNSEYKPIGDADYIVDSKNFIIDDKSKEKAHIDDEDIAKKIMSVDEILDKFSESVEKAEYIFAHNLNYNENILGAEYVRNKKSINMFSKKRYCLMEEGTYFCKIPAKGGGFKFPTLPELHAACFGQSYGPPGNARADVIAAARSFIKLMKTRQLEDLFDDE
jgi:DNA polymerase III epsilon subunit-like protein